MEEEARLSWFPLPKNRQVGRVAPRAPGLGSREDGADGVTRPTWFRGSEHEIWFPGSLSSGLSPLVPHGEERARSSQPWVEVLLAGMNPERFLTQFSEGEYDTLLFLDAVDVGAEPGSVVLLDSSEMQNRLPDAHPAAPSPVSALLSGVMIKTGVYGLMRYFLWLPPNGLMQGPQVCLAALCLALGLFEAMAFAFIRSALEASPQGQGTVLADAVPAEMGLWRGLEAVQGNAVFAPLAMAVVLVLMMVLARTVSRLGGARQGASGPWLCGYARETNVVRYNAHSFYGEFKRYFHWVGGHPRRPRNQTAMEAGNSERKAR